MFFNAACRIQAVTIFKFFCRRLSTTHFQRLATFRKTLIISFYTWLNICQEDVNPRHSSTTGIYCGLESPDCEIISTPNNNQNELSWSLTVIVTDKLSNFWVIHHSRVSFDGEQTLYSTRKRYRVFRTTECLNSINPCYGSWTEIIILDTHVWPSVQPGMSGGLLATWWFEHHHSSTTERTNCSIIHTAPQFACRLLQFAHNSVTYD